MLELERYAKFAVFAPLHLVVQRDEHKTIPLALLLINLLGLSDVFVCKRSIVLVHLVGHRKQELNSLFLL